MNINPQAAKNLKNYKTINRDLFKFREYAKDIKVQILKNGYKAYNNLRFQKGQSMLKLTIYTKPFKGRENKDLESQLCSIRVVEQRKKSSGDLSVVSVRSRAGKVHH